MITRNGDLRKLWGIIELRTQNSELRTQNTELRTQNTDTDC